MQTEFGYTRKSNNGTLDQLMQVASSRDAIVDIDLGKIRTLPQVRKNFRNIEELAQSLIEEGQQTPIIVSPINSEGVYILQKGERRFRAAQKAGLKTIRAIIGEVAESPLDETAGQLVENIQRENLDAMEVAMALKVFVDADWSQTRIAKRLGKTQVYVSRHLSLLSMPDIVRELFDAGIVGDVITLSSLRVLYEENKDLAQKLCDKAHEDGALSRSLVADTLRKVRELKEQATESTEEQAEPSLGSDVNPEAAAAQAQSHDWDDNEDEDEGDDLIHTAQVESYHAAFDDEQDTAEIGDVQTQLASRPPALQASDDANEQVSVADNESICIEVSFTAGDEQLQGMLMLNIVSPDPDFAWVQDQTGELHLVNVLRIGIMSVRTIAQ